MNTTTTASEDDADEALALARVVRDGLEVARAWRAAFPAECIRAAVGDHHLNLTRRGGGGGGDGDGDDNALRARDDADADAADSVAAALDCAVREAAPTILAVQRFLAATVESREASAAEDASSQPSSPASTEGVTVVELCNASRGHVAGMLLAALLPPRAVAEVVLVDARWPSKDASKKDKQNHQQQQQNTAVGLCSYKLHPVECDEPH